MPKILGASLVGVAAARCSGSADPQITGPICYHGKAGALGLTENVDVTIKDFASSAGHMDVGGNGIESFTCSNKAFTKNGQEISTDLTDCAPSAITISSVKYCSDDDTVQVVVKDKAVPIPITATLSKVDCASAFESGLDTMWKEFNKIHPQNGETGKGQFEKNVHHIVESNRAMANGVWSGINQFAAMSPEEFKSSMLGFTKPASDAPKLGVQKYSGATLPDSIDWSSQGAVTPIKNQGQCGSCWAFSTVGALEGRAEISTGKLQSFSEQQFVDCDKDQDQGCNGGLMDNAFKYAENNDICTEDSYSYKGVGGSCQTSSCTVGLKKGQVTGFVDVDATEDALAEAVAQGPVSVAVDAETIFQFYTGGIMSGTCGASLDHGVLVVGYGEDNGTKYWKVKNSWGSSWGESGYIRMKKGKGGKGQCGILTGPPSYPQIESSVSV